MKIGNLYIGAAREVRRLESLSDSVLLNLLGEYISGNKIIRCFKKAAFFIEKSNEKLNENAKISYGLIYLASWQTMYLGLITVVYVTFVFGIIIVFRELITAGVMGICLSYSLMLPPIINLSIVNLIEIEQCMISVERINSYISITPELPGKLATDPSNWPTSPSILFKNVNLRYRPNTPLILRNLSFSITPGGRIGFVGRTGSGKSTVFLAILRMVEVSRGAILIDGINIANIGLSTLRKAITSIPQDSIVFEGTLRDNLNPRKTASDAEMVAVMNDIGMSRLSIDHEIKGRGSNLSIGERQLISMGRALLSHTKILLMDEATAGIDEQADRTMQNLFRNRFSGCTVLVIAHRINTIIDSDEVIVIDRGEIIEQGNPSILKEGNTLFRKLVKDM